MKTILIMTFLCLFGPYTIAVIEQTVNKAEAYEDMQKNAEIIAVNNPGMRLP